MKKGKITESSKGEVTITCNFHNSVFDLSDGNCKTWCSKVMGIPGSEFLADISANFGGDKFTPATVYRVITENDRIILLL